MFIGPQSFTERGVSIDAIMGGVLSAMDDASRRHGIQSGLLISAHRHRSERDAFAMLEQVLPWSDRIIGIGMGGTEVGNPPSKFKNFFQACRDYGFRTTIHAGEEGPASYVREAFDLLKVDRIDHGNACLNDANLVRSLAEAQIPLTVCPLSNVRLKIVSSMEEHPLRRLMEAGLKVTVNSDDPPYFDGYVSENLIACQRALGLSCEEVVTLAGNSLTSAFVSADDKTLLLARMQAYVDAELTNGPSLKS
jgi:adenosine deaminase